MYSSWFNIIRTDQFDYDLKKKKYVFVEREGKKKDMGDTYIAGLNTSMMHEKYVRCEFNFQRTSQ